MWALRRASHPLKVQGCILGRSCSAKSVYTITCAEDRDSICDTLPVIYHRDLSLKRSYHTRCLYFDFFMGGRSFSSQAGAESSGSENDLEDGFCELDSPAATDVLVASEERDDDQLFASDAEEQAQEELGFVDDEADIAEKLPRRKMVSSELFKAIMNSPSLPVNSVLDKWVAEGKDLDRSEISSAMLNLRNRRMFGRALQLSEWLKTHKQLDFIESDYASRVDLIAKLRGIFKAEAYINNIPKSFRGELVYRTLLAACVAANNVKKAEEVFKRMKVLNFPVTAFSCNTLLLLYKRTDKKKIADVLLLMENEKVKSTLFTFKVLIDTKGQSNDITGMEQVVEAMKAEGIEPDIRTQAIIAGHYAFAGLKEKAVEVLKEMEGDNVDRWACKFMLPIYASIGEADEVERLWKACESDPRVDECKAAIKAWGMLKRVDKAEHVFEKMVKNKRNLSSVHYSGLLKVYADNKMVEKGKDLVQQMADKNIRIGPLTWDGLVKLHVEAGEVEKADSILQKAAEKSRMKPLYNSYIVIMEQYAKRGDVHNAEKIFHRMRQSGYVARIRQFQNLVQAYVNAKTPAYGIKDRMKADNIFPNRALATQLVQVDPFRKTSVSELLD